MDVVLMWCCAVIDESNWGGIGAFMNQLWPPPLIPPNAHEEARFYSPSPG